MSGWAHPAADWPRHELTPEQPIRLRSAADLQREIDAAAIAYAISYLREKGLHAQADAYAAAAFGEGIVLRAVVDA